MRFYAQARGIRITLPLLNLAVCLPYVDHAINRPSTGNTWLAVCWGFLTVLNTLVNWGIYWQVTPQGLVQARMFHRRLIPYHLIQDVCPDDSAVGKRCRNRIRVSLLENKPLFIRPDDYAPFVSALEQHPDPTLVHV